MAYFDKIRVNGTDRDIRDANAVHTDAAETLTDAQKATARGNIGAASAADLAGKVNADQGTANAGKALVVGTDGIVTTGEAGVPDAVKEALLTCFEHVAWADADGQTYYDALYAALYGSVVVVTYATVLYNDGTLVINERSDDRESNIAAHGSVTAEYDPMDDHHSYVFDSSNPAPWDSSKTTITQVIIGSEMRPTDIRNWFNSMTSCTSMTLNGLDTSQLTTLSGVFRNCTHLTSLNLTSFDTGNVTNMSNLFNGCNALSSVSFGARFTTSKVTVTGYMFDSCYVLSAIDMSGFDTGAMQTCVGMFNHCRGLTSLDVSSFDTSSVTDCTRMFQDCASLVTIYATSAFTIASGATSTGMFNGCTKLKGGAGTSYNSSYQTATRARIDGGTSAPGYFTAAV